MAHSNVRALTVSRNEILEITWLDLKTRDRLVERYSAPPAAVWQARFNDVRERDRAMKEEKEKEHARETGARTQEEGDGEVRDKPIREG